MLSEIARELVKRRNQMQYYLGLSAKRKAAKRRLGRIERQTRSNMLAGQPIHLLEDFMPELLTTEQGEFGRQYEEQILELCTAITEVDYLTEKYNAARTPESDNVTWPSSFWRRCRSGSRDSSGGL